MDTLIKANVGPNNLSVNCLFLDIVANLELLCFSRSKRCRLKLRSINAFICAFIEEIFWKAYIDKKAQLVLVLATISAVLGSSGDKSASSPKHVPALRPAM